MISILQTDNFVKYNVHWGRVIFVPILNAIEYNFLLNSIEMRLLIFEGGNKYV